MMQRLLTVTSGYLKFTFACMLAGTAVFFLMGLAIAAPRIFLITIALVAALFFIVRMEVKSHRHARELSKKNDPIRAWVEYLAFAEATSMVFSGVSEEIKMAAPSLWVSEWHHSYDPTTIPDSALMDKGLLEKAEMTSAIKDLQALQSELAVHGLYLLSISKKPAEQVVKSIQHAAPPGMWSRIIINHHGPGKAEHPLSIVFLHDTGIPLRVEVVQKLLQMSFQMVRAGINLQSKSTLP